MYESFDGQKEGWWCWKRCVLVNRMQIGQLVRSSGERPRFLPPQQVRGKICPNATNTPALSNVYEAYPSAKKLLQCTERQ